MLDGRHEHGILSLGAVTVYCYQCDTDCKLCACAVLCTTSA